MCFYLVLLKYFQRLQSHEEWGRLRLGNNFLQLTEQDLLR